MRTAPSPTGTAPSPFDSLTQDDLLGATVSLLWLSARALGIAAWLASSAAVLLGLAVATRLFQRVLRPQTTNVAPRM